MMPPTLLDAGPLVALIDQRDPFHAWAKARLGGARVPFVTCEPVIVETCFLLRGYPSAVRAAFALLTSGRVVIDFDLGGEVAEVGVEDAGGDLDAHGGQDSSRRAGSRRTPPCGR